MKLKLVILVLAVLVIVLGWRWISGPGGVSQVAFDSDAWQRAEPIEHHRTVRNQMVEDLLRRYRFSGWTRWQVVELLGEADNDQPSQLGFPQFDIVYVLGLERGGALSLDAEALGFKFDSSGRVTSYGLSVN